MLKFVKNGALMLCVAILAVAGLTGCDDDDPFANVTLPTVEVAPNTISGVVTSKKGDVVRGAVVVMGDMTAVTDTAGVYRFNDVLSGTYHLKVKADGFQTARGMVKVENAENTRHFVWNAVLASTYSEKEVTVDEKDTVYAEVVTEAKKGNEKALIKVDVEVPAAAVVSDTPDEDVDILVTPIYDVEQALADRIGTKTLLTGVKLSCPASNAQLKDSIGLAFHVDSSMKEAVAMKKVNGQWKQVPGKWEDDKLVLAADEFTSYGLFMPVSYASEPSDSIQVVGKSLNNLFGVMAMMVYDVDYDYQVGLEINGGSNTLEALLVEKLVAKYGASVASVHATYPLNFLIPIGILFEFKAMQSAAKVSASAAGATVSGSLYDMVNVNVIMSNREESPES